MKHPDLPNRPDQGDENIERLLRHADGEAPRMPAEPAARLTEAMKAAAIERANERSAGQGGASEPAAVSAARPSDAGNRRPLSPAAGLGIAALTATLVAAVVWFGQLALEQVGDSSRALVPAFGPEPAPAAPRDTDDSAEPQAAAIQARVSGSLLAELRPRARPEADAPALVLAPATLSTGDGEQRRVTLADGSVLYVDSGTIAHVRAGRVVVLERGRIYVEVAPAASAAAPFEILVADHRVQALGTRIGAALDPATQRADVVVTQGRVRLQTAAGAEGFLDAGQQVSLAPAPTGRIEPRPAPALAESLAWLRPLLEAAETPLVPARADVDGGAIVVTDERGEESRLTLRKLHVDVHIEDGFARTTVLQTYFNHTNRQLEGTFHFPLPADASISRLAMYVEGELMEGGMVERDRGRTVFETIRHQRRDPALLEWVDGNVFKMRVFPLFGRQEKVILISYTQRLRSQGGAESYRFPVGHSHEGKLREFSFSGKLAGAGDRGWSCDGVPAAMHVEGRDRLLTSASAGAPTRDIEIRIDAPVAAYGPVVRLAEHDGERYLGVRAPVELPLPPRKTARHWVLLFESSSSRNPLLARVQCDVARAILENAEHTDTFCLVTAASRVRAFRDDPVAATTQNVAAALAFLDRAHLLGGLDLGRAFASAAELLAQAPAGKQPTLVHLGAGIATLGETAPDRLAARIPDDAEYVGVAIGKSWSRPLMQAAARRTGGFTCQLNPDAANRWSALEVVSQLESPRLSWIQVTGTGDDANSLTLLPLDTTVFPGGEVLAIARLAQGAALPTTITIRGLVGRTPFESTVPIPAGLADDGSAGYLPRTWTRLEIDRLVEEDRAANRDRIVALSKAMYVLSPFTSLLVLENEAMYTQYGVDRGRKDHWALFPAPARIPVVHEPVQQPPPAATATDAEDSGESNEPTERERITQSLRQLAWSRVSSGVLYWPDRLSPPEDRRTSYVGSEILTRPAGAARSRDYLTDFPGGSIQLIEAGLNLDIELLDNVRGFIQLENQRSEGGRDQGFPFLGQGQNTQRGGDNNLSLDVEQAFIEWDTPIGGLRMRAGISDLAFDLRGDGNAWFMDIAESEGVGPEINITGGFGGLVPGPFHVAGGHGTTDLIVGEAPYDLFFDDSGIDTGETNSLSSLGVEWRGLGDAGLDFGVDIFRDDLQISGSLGSFTHRLPFNLGEGGFEDSPWARFDEFLVGIPDAPTPYRRWISAETRGHWVGNPTDGYWRGGIFFDDGRDGDFRARVENLFDEPLGRAQTVTGGITLRWAPVGGRFTVNARGDTRDDRFRDSTRGEGTMRRVDRMFAAVARAQRERGLGGQARAAVSTDPALLPETPGAADRRRAARDSVLGQERHEARHRARRIRDLYGDGIRAFEGREFQQAENVAREILRLNPGDRHALRLRDQSVMLRHRKGQQLADSRKVKYWREFLQDMQEAQIPWQETIVWPDEDTWTSINQRARGSAFESGAGPEPVSRFEVRPAFLDAGNSAAARTIADRLRSTRVTLEFEEQPLPEVLAFIGDIADVNIVCDPELAEEFDTQGILVTLPLEDAPLTDALATLCETYGLTARFTDDVLFITGAPWKRPRSWVAVPAGELIYAAPATKAGHPPSGFYSDLAAHCPGLTTTGADALAAVDAGAPELVERGRIEAGARALIEGARSAGWRSVSRGDSTLVFDGQGRYSLSRKVGPGFAEQVVCDGEQLLHLYRELGLVARRDVTRHHRAGLRQLVPWHLPPAEDLAVGADLTLASERVVRVTPLDAEAPARLELHFGAEGRLAERRTVLRESGETILSESYGADGEVKIADGKGEPMAQASVVTARVEAPELAPPLAGFVILPLPFLDRAAMLEKVGSSRHADLPEEQALALLGAYWAAGDGWNMAQLFRQRGWDTHRDRPGMQVLLAGVAGKGLLPALPLLTDSPASAYVQTLRGVDERSRIPEGSTLRRLADLRWAFLGLAGKKDAGGNARAPLTADRVLALMSSSSPDLATQLLAAVNQHGDAELRVALVPHREQVGERCGDGYHARYQLASLLEAGGEQEEAALLFESLYSEAGEAIATPPINGSFRRALESTDRWQALLKQRAVDLLASRQRSAVLDLALQATHLEDTELARELVGLVLADVEGQEIGPRLCRDLLQYALLAQDWSLALEQLESLLQRDGFRESLQTLTLAADIAGKASEPARRAQFLEAALELELRGMGDEIEVAWVRDRFGALMAAYAAIAQDDDATRPEALLASVVLAADRWIQLDPDPSAASLQAARILDLLGEADLARDYETVAIDLSPTNSAPWAALAGSLKARNHPERAAAAYAQAFTLEPTNPQHLWGQAEVLSTLGKTVEAKELYQQIARGEWQPRFRNLQRQAKAK